MSFSAPALTALAEDLSLVPISQLSISPVPEGLISSSDLLKYQVYMCICKTLIKINNHFRKHLGYEDFSKGLPHLQVKKLVREDEQHLKQIFNCSETRLF